MTRPSPDAPTRRAAARPCAALVLSVIVVASSPATAAGGDADESIEDANLPAIPEAIDGGRDVDDPAPESGDPSDQGDVDGSAPEADDPSGHLDGPAHVEGSAPVRRGAAAAVVPPVTSTTVVAVGPPPVPPTTAVAVAAPPVPTRQPRSAAITRPSASALGAAALGTISGRVGAVLVDVAERAGVRS